MSLKDDLYAELFVKIRVEVEGINATPKDFAGIELGTKYLERVHIDPENLTQIKAGTLIPGGFKTPHGLSLGFGWNPRSSFSVANHDGKYFLQEHGKDIFVASHKNHRFYYFTTLRPFWM